MECRIQVWVDDKGDLMLQGCNTDCCRGRLGCGVNSGRAIALRSLGQSCDIQEPGVLVLSLPDKALLYLLILFYGMPLAGLLLVLCVAASVWQDSGVAAQLLAALSGATFGYFFAWLVSRFVFAQLSFPKLSLSGEMQYH